MKRTGEDRSSYDLRLNLPEKEILASSSSSEEASRKEEGAIIANILSSSPSFHLSTEILRASLMRECQLVSFKWPYIHRIERLSVHLKSGIFNGDATGVTQPARAPAMATNCGQQLSDIE